MNKQKCFTRVLTIIGFAAPFFFLLSRWLLFLAEGEGPSLAGKVLGYLGTAGLYASGPLGCLAVLTVAVMNWKRQNLFDRLGLLFLLLINLGLAFFHPLGAGAFRVRSELSGYPDTMTFSGGSRDGEKMYRHPSEQDWINIESSRKPVILNFSSSGITDDELARLAGNRRVRRIRIHDCPNITDRVVQSLSEIPGLEGIVLVGCPQLKDPDFSVLSRLKKLSDLNLTGSVNLSEQSLGSIASLSRLKRLFLSGCLGVNESVLSKICRLKRLRLLDLAMCRNVSDRAVAKLASMKSLRALSLHGCILVSGKGIEPLSKLPIKVLDFPVHLYSDEGIDTIVLFSNLAVLSLNSELVCHNPEIHLVTRDKTNPIPFDEKDRPPMRSESSLLKLGKMKSLRRLLYSGSRESKEFKALQKKLPKCRITW